MKTKSFIVMLFIVAALFSCSKKDEMNATGSAENTAVEKLTIADVDLNDPDLEELWKKEPRYGTTLQVDFNGGLCTSGLGIATVHGFFAKHGLKAEIKNIVNAFDAIGTGRIDAMTDHISTSLVPAVNGINMVFTRGAQTGCKSLYVLNNSDIKITNDLLGKTVAIHDGVGGSDHNIALRFFARDKVDYSQLKFKNVETAATIQAMQSGEIDASIFSDQFAYKFVESGVLRIIRSITFDDDFKTEPCCVLILNKDFVEQNPITAAKLTLAHREASSWMEEHKHETAEIISANNWGSGDVDLDQKFLETYNFKVPDEITEAALMNVIADYKTFNLINKDLNTDDILNNIWRPIKK